MRVLITGADGFVGKNLSVRLNELPNIIVQKFSHTSSTVDLIDAINNTDFIFHLAGVNRPSHVSEFQEVNLGLTKTLCDLIEASGKEIPIVFSSSTQAFLDNPYGLSKKLAEEYLLDFSNRTNSCVYIYRLPGLFGKWCRPNYNSVVATFCYNVSHDLPITIHDPQSPLKLVYIDDLLSEFIHVLNNFSQLESGFRNVSTEYLTTVGEVASLLHQFKASRDSLIIEKVGTGFVRALYSTYITYLEPKQFSYYIKKYEDPRGMFAEMLKTQDSGQVSFFTAPPGVTRGEHYHHTKTEKFLVAKGQARFRFRQVMIGELYEIIVSSENPQIVETIPGWVHDITNIGNDEMLVILWANEIFDREHPDTIGQKI